MSGCNSGGLNFTPAGLSKLRKPAHAARQRNRHGKRRMSPQVKQFLKLFIAVIIALHLLVGAVYLTSWLTGREHASGSVQPPAQQR